MSINSVLVCSETEVILERPEYERLLKIESLLWQIECAMPSGLESWVDDEELEKLRGE
ncbi:hypothetical protein AU156_gp083 [Edwardsiella phage PEi20]|uniref:Uncharacterized protein n=2 Tax=Kanagawavirus pei20 TaxID=2844109 RepID=A0A0B6VRF7_9CAUD|nr:hypothetical protein AU156_gp083 [Edwardsiella phage PEi20]BAQ22733.1 conserved hypothetical protein [Edwardsiella phage PEi20]BAQ23034.1 conserved hypothetical protein [Edwardsiella phage PEi26]